MAYSEAFVERIRAVLRDKNIFFEEKKMFGGVCFMVDEKMCCGTHTTKNRGELLMCRIGEAFYPNALATEHCIPMEFTGKPMKGYVYVLEDGLATYKDLAYWVQACLDFNPKAVKNKK